MIKLKATTQYLIIVLIFILSVYIGLKDSQLLQKSKPELTINNKQVEQIFNESINFKKIRTIYKTDNLEETLNQLSNIISEESMNDIYSIKKSNYFVGIYEFDTENYKKIINSLRSVKGLETERVEKKNNVEKFVNIDENIKNYKMSKEAIKAQLTSKAISSSSKRELRKELDRIQAKIDSLIYLPKFIEKSKKNDLLYISIQQNLASASTTSDKVKIFLKTTPLVLLGLSLGLVILYLFLILMIKLMKLMGVRTSSSGSAGNGYNNYYTRGKKKVKRKYKDDSDK